MNESPPTRLDKILDWFKNHRLWAWLIFGGMLIVALGAVAGAVTQLIDLGKLLPGNDDLPPAAGSITVSLPPGLTFRQAMELLATDTRGVVSFDRECPEQLLEATINAESMRAANVVALMKNLRHKLPVEVRSINYDVQTDENRGLYEITCHE